MPRKSRVSLTAGLLIDQASEQALHDLTGTFATGGIIGLVGAGSSMRVGYPSWMGLLKELKSRALRVSSPEIVENLEFQHDLLVRAGRYRQHLGENHYGVLMREIFGPRTPQFTRFHESVVSLPFRHILTTNYDGVLDAAHRKVFGFIPTIVDAKDHADLGTFVSNIGMPHGYGRRFYVHLHGRYEAPSSVVLTETDYVERYERSASMPLALMSVIATNQLLAIGFSLSDLDVLHLFRSVRAKLHSGKPRHFAFLGLENVRQAAAERVRLHEKYGIEPIFYRATRDHSGLDALVKRLDQLLRNAYPRLFEPREIRYVHRLRGGHPVVGRDHELKILTAKYGDPQPGVVVVMGPSGSGKRSLVDVFLRTVVEPSPLPVRALLWSFRNIMRGAYDISAYQSLFDPVHEFARAAYRFCSGQYLPGSVESAFGHLTDALKSAGRTVFVLDGLDELGSDDSEELRLRDDFREFIEFAARGQGQALIVATTTKRLQLPHRAFVEIIDVSRLSENAAVSLLSPNPDQPVSDELMKQLASSVGNHAKSLKVFGALIAGPYGQDRERALRLVKEKGIESTSRSEAIQILYREPLGLLDEAAGSLLNALSRITIPQTLESLALAFSTQNSSGEESPGGLSKERLDQLVLLLVEVGILRTYVGARRPLYACDPAASRLRNSLPEPLETDALETEDAVDLISDLTGAAFPQQAFSVYRRLNSWLLTASEYRLGERATRTFFKLGDIRQFAEGLSAQQEGIILSDHGVFLHGLGRLDEAVRLQELSKERDWQNRRDLAWDDFRLASVNISRGALHVALNILAEVCQYARDQDHNLALLSYTAAADAAILAGNLSQARELLERAGEIQGQGLDGLHGAPALAHAEFLLRQAKLAAARSVIVANLLYCRHWKREGDVLVCLLQLAEIEVATSRFLPALTYVRHVRRAADRKGWQAMLCRSFIVGGWALRLAGRDLEARAELLHGLEIAKHCGFALLQADLLYGLSELTRTSDGASSKRYASKALRLAKSCGYMWMARSAPPVSLASDRVAH